MLTKNRIKTLLLLSSYLAAGNALGAGVTDGVVYQKEDRFVGSVHLTDSFVIEAKGLYRATLKDFESTSAFESSSMEITGGTNSLGNLAGPGSFTFKAGPGDYNVNMLAELGRSQVSAEKKQQLMDEERDKRRIGGKKWWQSLTREQKDAKKELWASRSKETWADIHKMERKRDERRVEEQLAAMNTGKYGIEISALESPVAPTVVPLPAAAWLFGSGILALAGIGRRKARR